MEDLMDYNSSPPAAPSRNLPVREDFWSEDATSTLVHSWGRRYLHLNRGNLRLKDWQDVADSVNSLHGLSTKAYRTHVQCKNRIDTVKKKFKVENSRVVASNGSYVSPWAFYNRLDELIGPIAPSGIAPSSSSGKKGGQQAPVLTYRKAVPVSMAAPAAAAVSLPQKRERERDIRRNYSEVAAAAAAAEDMEDDDDEVDLDRESDGDEEEVEERSMRRLANAIERFGEVYRRVEGEKLRQMVELEKQRMQFAKDLEVQRLKMFMDTQVQMERLKRAESDDVYS